MRTVVACLVSLSTALAGVAAAAAVGFAGTSPKTVAVLKPAAPPACTTDDLNATLIGHSRRPEHGVWTAAMRFTNASPRTCRVEGWPEIALVSAPGDLVPVGVTTVNQPAAARPIDLKPNASAWAGLRWHTCDAAASGCKAGVALQFKVDPESDGAAADFQDFPAAEKDGLAMTSLQVGTLQSGRDGVLAGK